MQKGNLTISRPSFGSEKKAIVIRVTDASSHTEFLSVEIGYDAFTEALTGVGHVECDLDLRNLDRVGKIRQHKTELVPVPPGVYALLKERAQVAAPFLAPFEVEGWKGQVEDIFNGNRSERIADGTCYQRVAFVRYVEGEPATDKPIQVGNDHDAHPTIG